MSRRRTARIGAALIAVAVFAGTPIHGATASQRSLATHNEGAAPQVVQFNIWGGRGDAFNDYNETVDVAIVNSLLSRSNTPWVVGLNEVCSTHYATMLWLLNANGRGYSTSNPTGYSYDHMLALGDYFGTRIGNDDLDPDCGDWYGNALFMRRAFVGPGGADFFASQEPQASGEQRSWLCKSTGGPTACVTHLENGPVIYTYAQSASFRSIAIYCDNFGVFALGDFNYDGQVHGQAAANERAAWDATFNESDGTRDTTDGATVRHLDYIWRKNFGAWPTHSMYIDDSAHSDHHWYQGYITTVANAQGW